MYLILVVSTKISPSFCLSVCPIHHAESMLIFLFMLVILFIHTLEYQITLMLTTGTREGPHCAFETAAEREARFVERLEFCSHCYCGIDTTLQEARQYHRHGERLFPETSKQRQLEKQRKADSQESVDPVHILYYLCT